MNIRGTGAADFQHHGLGITIGAHLDGLFEAPRASYGIEGDLDLAGFPRSDWFVGVFGFGASAFGLGLQYHEIARTGVGKFKIVGCGSIVFNRSEIPDFFFKLYGWRSGSGVGNES